MKHTLCRLVALVTIPALAAALAGAAGGCASGQRAAAAAASDVPPPDFMLGLTVLTPPPDGSAPPAGGAADAAPAPVRHVMEADWVLRTGLGPGAGPEVFPARTRQLDHGEVMALWRSLREGGLLRADHPARIGGWPAEAPPPLRPVYLVELAMAGEMRVLAIDAAGEGGEAARAVAEQLGALVWVK